jgi:hypothetical protein
MDKFHGIVGAPELISRAGDSIQLTSRLIRVDYHSGFRALDLAQLDGTLLALDWVVGETHHIWGSAVMVAPGVALTARHVFDHLRREGFLGEVGGYLLALGFHKHGMAIWNPDSFTNIGDGDLALLTLVRATASPNPAADAPVPVNVAVLAARQPSIEERISLFGFVASELKFEKLNDGNGAGLSLLGSVGPVTDVYGAGRDRTLPNPSAAVAAKTIGGMSGGGAFDAQGRLIGVITSGFADEVSFISLSWSSVFTPLQIAWPHGLVQSPTTLHAMADQGLCHIDGIEALRSGVDESGGPIVSLIHPLFNSGTP